MARRFIWLCLIVFLTNITHAESLINMLPGVYQNELQQVKSPDGRSVAILFQKESRGLGLPPEPPKVSERWARLKLTENGRTIYDSGDENLNIYQRSPFALDVMWSPDSNHLAYRHITSLRIIGLDGKACTPNVVPDDSVISSFRWIDKENLLVVSKGERYPLAMAEKPFHYNGYIDKSKDIRITRLNLTKGKTECYQQAVNDPTFLFHSIGFCVEEISPKADRVAFSDGVNLCIYDDTIGKLLAKVTIPQKQVPKSGSVASLASGEMRENAAQIEGVWWQTNDRLVIGIGLLGSPDKSFYTYDIPSKAMIDVTSVLLPVWMGSNDARNYKDADWYRAAIK